jgi:uncharacterized DUF497 family protein
VDFEWDAAKAESNERKHGISFEVAAGVFADSERLERLDSDSSEDEERWAVTGLIDGTEVYVVYVLRGDVVRLISARRANRHEREEYWNRTI